MSRNVDVRQPRDNRRIHICRLGSPRAADVRSLAMVRVRTLGTIVVAALASSLTAAPTRAATSPATPAGAAPVSKKETVPQKHVPGGIRLLVDDDTSKFFLGLANGTDHYYTEGARLLWFSTSSPLSFSLAEPRRWWPTQVGWGLTLGQSMYTPANIDDPLLQPYDRPYGAWLYGGLLARLWWLKPDDPDYHPSSLVFDLDVGVIGPWALGYQFQTGAHYAIRWGDRDGDPSDPKGWGYQIGNQHNFVGANLRTVWQRELARCRPLSWLGTELHVEGVAEVGNVFVRAGAGLFARVGYLDQGIPTMTTIHGDPSWLQDRQNPRPVDQTMPARRQAWELFLIAKAEPILVGWNLFVQGSADSHGLAAAPVVIETALGPVLRIRSFLFSWTLVTRSRETRDELPAVTGATERSWLFAHKFARIQIAWEFDR